MGEFLLSINRMKVYFILSVAVCIFFAKTYSISLGPDPFSRGKPCTANSTCNSDLGVMCCGEGTTYGRCCPDGLCKSCTQTSDSSTFYYCGTVCPDYPKTTQSNYDQHNNNNNHNNFIYNYDQHNNNNIFFNIAICTDIN